MKQIIKLAELNMALVFANREEIAATNAKDKEAVETAKSKIIIAQEAFDKHLSGKRLNNEITKYMNRQNEVAEALKAAGYDTAVLDFFE